MRTLNLPLVALALLALWPARAWSGSPDVERQIQSIRGTANDLEALDAERRVREEIGVLKSWLDEATTYNTRNAENTARRFLDLCVVQTELIRQRLQTVKLQAEADQKRQAVAETRKKIQQTKDAIEKSKMKKAGLEAQTK